MDYISVDLGFDVNILTRQTWESMGKPHLDWYPTYPRIANQVKVLPIRCLSRVPEGLHTFADFEVINIVDDTKPYPALLGID